MNSCVIVGAGITGLTAARHLQKKGWTVTLLEKAARPGGRMATRVIDQTIFDYGAQFITTYSLPFRALFEDWQDAHLVDEWCRGFLSGDRTLTYDGYARYRAKQGINEIPQFMAQDLTIRFDTQVASIQHAGESWVIHTINGENVSTPVLILALPAPLARKLLAPEVMLADEPREALERIKYEPCITMMAVTSGESGIPEPGAIQFQGEPIQWISDNSQKNNAPVQQGLTIHTGKMFSKQYWKTEPAALIPLLWEMVRPHVTCELVSAQVHRWLYSRPLVKHPHPFLLANSQPVLLFAGDAFGESQDATIESAAMSGLAAAKYLVKNPQG